MDVPLTTNLDARGAGCPAGLRSLEPMGRGQDCLLSFAAGFGDHYFDSDCELFDRFLELFDHFRII
jgi:hypothetical protein